MHERFDRVSSYKSICVATFGVEREREIGTDMLLYTIVNGVEDKITHSLPHCCALFKCKERFGSYNIGL